MPKVNPKFWGSFVIGLLFLGCSSDYSRKHYALAEQLWSKGNYQEAVKEFDHVIQRAPKSALGVQALFRAAMTETVFLKRHESALTRLRRYVEPSLEAALDPELIWSAEHQIGIILLDHLGNYREAAEHYARMAKTTLILTEVPHLTLREAEARSKLWQFDSALELYKQILTNFSGTPEAETASYRSAEVWFARAMESQQANASDLEFYQKALSAYEAFILAYPKSTHVPDARFGAAFVLEELNRLDEALSAFEKLKVDYPQWPSIDVKIHRIRARIERRKPS